MRVTNRQDELAALIERNNDEPRPLTHPTMSRRYRSEIKALTHAFINGGAELQAREQVRRLIEKIVLTPKDTDDDLSIDLYGDLAGILRIATEDKATKVKGTIEKRLDSVIVTDNHTIEPSDQLVAGAGCQRCLSCW